jgi:hypothetical protein
MQFCIRDDDTSFFTSPDQLERAYGDITKHGPISLSIIPFCSAGHSLGVPEKFRGRWSIHPLHENVGLVEWLRVNIAAGRYEAMLHGYHHDVPDSRREFVGGEYLTQRVSEGRHYLEDLLGAPVRVFVPPHNAIGSGGLRAMAHAGLHLGCVAGLRSGWAPFSPATWATWIRLRRWRARGGMGIPWVLDLGDHREIAGNPVSPSSNFRQNEAIFDDAMKLDGVFCAATHYWELDSPSMEPDTQTVGEHLRRMIARAKSDPRVIWRSVGEILTVGTSKN